MRKISCDSVSWSVIVCAVLCLRNICVNVHVKGETVNFRTLGKVLDLKIALKCREYNILCHITTTE